MKTVCFVCRPLDADTLKVSLQVDSLQLGESVPQGCEQAPERPATEVDAAKPALECFRKTSSAESETLQRRCVAEKELSQVVLIAGNTLELEICELLERETL